MVDLVDNGHTDKNTTHSYLELYQRVLESKRDLAKNILEIGIGPCKNSNGGSIKLWHDFFVNAEIHAVDIIHKNNVWDKIMNNKRIILHTGTNGYDQKIFDERFFSPGIRFDMMLDDGPHTLASMISFIKLYSQVMTDDGVLIIEDVQSYDWINHLTDATPEHLRKYIKIYDLRPTKNRYDDIVFMIDKLNI